MKAEHIETLFISATMIVIIALTSTTSFIFGRENGYRSGQIDALSGKIKYELKDQPPEWVERGEGK